MAKLGSKQNNMSNSPYLIAITGGIGSGKSQVANFLKSVGKMVISCDEITPSMYLNPLVKQKLAQIFPQAYNPKDDLIDKSIVAKTVFSDKQKLKELTDFLAPQILQECLSQAKKIDGMVFIEVPLLFEFGAEKEFDKVIVVTRNLNDRIQSVMTRNNLKKQEVLERISSQFDYDKADLSNYIVVENNSSLQDLNSQVEKLLKTL